MKGWIKYDSRYDLTFLVSDKNYTVREKNCCPNRKFLIQEILI